MTEVVTLDETLVYVLHDLARTVASFAVRVPSVRKCIHSSRLIGVIASPPFEAPRVEI